ncbi:MAG: stage II sporulation protein P [Clostridia bacterium]|nr:stage II sporulation protein P [Clostridia bacterium]
MKNSKIKTVLCSLVAVLLGTVGIFSVFHRGSQNEALKQNLTLAAAAFVMPERGLRARTTPAVATPDSEKTQPTESSTLPATDDEETQPTEAVDLHEDEVHLPVITSQFGESGVSCDNFYIKDTVGEDTDFETILNLPLGFEFERNNKVQVLIFHTHTTESYLEYDQGYYHESFYPRSEDESKNMVSVGREIAKSLEAQGIGVVHATEVHDSPEYNGAYYRSWDTIEKYMEKYPDIKVVLDIHRDSIAGEGGAKVKPTFEVQGKKAAQIMIMAGCDPNGEYDFPDWEYNLRFALKLQQYAEDMYPGMTRPLYFGYFSYNMPISRGGLLIEVGTDVNTVSEAQYTGKLLGNVLAKVLQSEG